MAAAVSTRATGRQTRSRLRLHDAPRPVVAAPLGLPSVKGSDRRRKKTTAKEKEDNLIRAIQPVVPQQEDIIAQLHERWERLQEERQRQADEPIKAAEARAAGVNLGELLAGESGIETIRKESVFAAEITADEASLIARRVAEKQRQLQAFQRRQERSKAGRVLSVFHHITEEEALATLEQCDGNEEEAISLLTNHFFLHRIRKGIAIRYMESATAVAPSPAPRRKHVQSAPKSHKVKPKSGFVRKRLLLNDALKQNDMEGWSEARIRAYKMIETNPNAYYYRFLAPGETQRTGAWSAEERELFLKRRAEMPVDGQWGLFSMAIPGRVGYQCSNFYRLLLEQGEITDPHYYLDTRGKAHYIFKTTKRRDRDAKSPAVAADPPSEGGSASRGEPAEADAGQSQPQEQQQQQQQQQKRRRRRRRAPPQRPKAPKKLKRARNWDSDSDDDDGGGVDDDSDVEYRPAWASKRSRRSEEEDAAVAEARRQVENPLPGFIDPITLEEVVEPAMSPFGHVMGYQTWCRTLMQLPRNTCPFTKKTFTKRELVILTAENIEQHRDKIVNVDQ